ncbi:hypothetical protein, partial [Klebsiella pneumoniae]|uniref:hypothetical protein n=1 Tax=Klebsiella pneumoniae TaxID=573 RepID=UPI001D18E99C
MGKAPANGLSEAHAVGVYSRVAVFQDESGQKGHSQVLLTLRTENTQALPAGEFDQFELPFCNGHILVPDPGYGAPVVFLNNVLGLGFRFREGTCSMHCYTVEDARLGATQTLTEVAEALVSNVEVLLTLRTENTQALPAGEFDQFELPFCNGHILVPDPGYGAPVVFLNNVLGLGFRFREGTCSMHCYTVEDARLGATQTLTEVAEALVSNVDAP